MWPRIGTIGLDAAAIAARRGFIGGSDANIIMSGDDEAVLTLWMIKRGEAEAENLDAVLPVVMGQWTEDLNAQWYAARTGREVTHRGEVVHHPEHGFMRASLDGRVALPAGAAIWEGKHVNAFSKPADVLVRYQPQLHHNMLCAGVSHAVLSVFIGTLVFDPVEVELDPFYALDLVEAERRFWERVNSGEPPVAVAPIAPPVPPEQWRDVDMSASNEWGDAAGRWIENAAAAKRFAAAEKDVKALVPADAGTTWGGGIEVKRAKNGSLRIGERKAV